MANRASDAALLSATCPVCAEYFLSVVFGDHYDESFLTEGNVVIPDNFFQDILLHIKERVKVTLMNLGYYDTDEKMTL